VEIDTRTSRSGWCSRRFPRRGTSQFTAKLGIVLTVRTRAFSGRLVQPVEKLGQRRSIALADACQCNPFAREATEQRTPEPGLERLHLLPHGARRHGKFVTGALEVEVPGRGLETAQVRQGWKAATGH
jgi:hypothetical protein